MEPYSCPNMTDRLVHQDPSLQKETDTHDAVVERRSRRHTTAYGTLHAVGCPSKGIGAFLKAVERFTTELDSFIIS